MAYIPNFTWTVADGDQVSQMARAGYTAYQIATIMGRTAGDVAKFCQDNRIHVRKAQVPA